MPNKVEAGMRFRRRDDGKTFTAVSEWGKGRSSINGQPDWYVEEDDSHRSLSSDDLYEPIPEPAPELCARCDLHAAATVHHAWITGCHDFVHPQAKPVLREPKPRADGYPDVCLYCCGEKTTPSICGNCLRALSPEFAAKLVREWFAKPAAKDIPSAVVAAKCSPATEAARGGEAAITSSTTFRRTFREYAPSAVAAAPGIEPWRPTVDDWDLLPDAETGWRR